MSPDLEFDVDRYLTIFDRSNFHGNLLAVLMSFRTCHAMLWRRLEKSAHDSPW